ncbi:hypothetical protein B0J11DRAFT_552943 [Dendryphion nanum]|uniref:Glycosyltransferase family 2 protein n=1 Tax=Dendryphion nanum TaxID=256645 RepID=A0A9P9DE10_9PLEO|nr:hypothetical protein B0J11DRAFT_552943 [Dendryphion nanum]
MFMFRYIRVITNFFAYCAYRPTPIPKNPTFKPSDVTIVIPTTALNLETLHKEVVSILRHDIAALIITTAGPKVKKDIDMFKAMFTDPRIQVLHRDVPNRREQTALATNMIQTSNIVICDDHTFWPVKTTFLPSLLALFEDPMMGGVGPIIEVVNCQHPYGWKGLWNFMGMAYLVQFLHAYLDEYIFWGLVGPIAADDDKFVTRWLNNHGWKIKVQCGPDSNLQTELGEWPKFATDQLLRWNRTTWRSNPRALFTERVSWLRFPYTTYSNTVYSLFRFTALYEATLYILLFKTLHARNLDDRIISAGLSLTSWIIGWKFVKICPLFVKHPSQLAYFGAYLLFGWYCSAVKIYALFTCADMSWGTAKTAMQDDDAVIPLFSKDQV